MDYANLDEHGVCVGISSLNEAIEGDSLYVEIPTYDPSYLRRRYIDGAWTDEVVPVSAYEAEFVDTNPEPIEPGEVEETPRDWRDNELARTDWLVVIPDHPNRENLLVYRQSLRDWPKHNGFPEVSSRPELRSI